MKSMKSIGKLNHSKMAPSTVILMLAGVFAQRVCGLRQRFISHTAYRPMHGLGVQVNPARPFDTAEIGIDGDCVENLLIQQFEKHAAALFWFDTKNALHSIVESNFQTVIRQRLG
jgi:hypothetical protein